MLNLLLIINKPIERANDLAGCIGRNLSVCAMGLMVLIILIQVYFRYVLNNALPWPDEAARFLMLWLAGLMGPIALRQGSMVAIVGVQSLLPGFICKVLIFNLLLISFAVLLVAVKLGWAHVNSGWLFASSSLKLPLDLIGMKATKMKLAWSYMSLFVGFCLMLLVNLELLLRTAIGMFGGETLLKPINNTKEMKVE
ncbi:MAG: C4-dicarboxylate ABC transporter permease [SAR116 cluster bacterium]|nr:C4-dicarboxylate ABC transporter permease [SAR116 cluster bacterium]|tara:strand:- start:1410 stop:2000 length:591 start_codon:yes stop_codon:yes gene_type:complete